MSLRTRLTERLGIEHPIVSAPMGLFAGGRLAAAVSRAGGLGLIGGGYGDGDWLDRELSAAGNERVGCGFITWSLEKSRNCWKPRWRDRPQRSCCPSDRPVGSRSRSSGPAFRSSARYSRKQRIEAVEAGAEIIVAQGAEAGGHSGKRSTFTLVPELADLLGKMPQHIARRCGGHRRRPRARGRAHVGGGWRPDRLAACRELRGGDAGGISPRNRRRGRRTRPPGPASSISSATMSGLETNSAPARSGIASLRRGMDAKRRSRNP